MRRSVRTYYMPVHCHCYCRWVDRPMRLCGSRYDLQEIVAARSTAVPLTYIHRKNRVRKVEEIEGIHEPPPIPANLKTTPTLAILHNKVKLSFRIILCNQRSVVDIFSSASLYVHTAVVSCIVVVICRVLVVRNKESTRSAIR